MVSLLAFIHWLETGTLLLHTEAEEKLGCTFRLSVIVHGYIFISLYNLSGILMFPASFIYVSISFVKSMLNFVDKWISNQWIGVLFPLLESSPCSGFFIDKFKIQVSD